MLPQLHTGLDISMVMLIPCTDNLVGRTYCKHFSKQESKELIAQGNEYVQEEMAVTSHAIIHKSEKMFLVHPLKQLMWGCKNKLHSS